MPLALSVGPAPRAGPPSTSPRAGGHLPQTAHPPGPSRRWRCASGRWHPGGCHCPPMALRGHARPGRAYYSESTRSQLTCK